LKSSDLQIQIKGSHLAKPSQLSITIYNNHYQSDTANVTINITMNHLIRGDPVCLIKDFYNVTCRWNYTKEIGKNWKFEISNRKYSRGIVILEVKIKGIDDDLNLYAYKKTYGIIIRPFMVRIFPLL
jgi:hypothetical protein